MGKILQGSNLIIKNCSLEDLGHGVMIKLPVDDLSHGLMIRLLPWSILPMV
jgi:hypothetical protein